MTIVLAQGIPAAFDYIYREPQHSRFAMLLIQPYLDPRTALRTCDAKVMFW